MFGFGNAFDTVVSGLAYRYSLKRNKLTIFNPNEKSPLRLFGFIQIKLLGIKRLSESIGIVSSDSDEDFEEYLLNHGSKEWVEYYLKVKAYKEREYKKGCIVN